PERFKKILMQSIGLAILFIGISGALQGIFQITASGAISRRDIIEMIIFMVLGGLLGELAKIEQGLDLLGKRIQQHIKGNNHFAEGFVTASLIFCVGAMAVVGSLEDGLTGSRETLYAKSVLDGVISVILASTLGIGVAFSAVSVAVYQGSITLLASVLRPLLAAEVVSQMSLVGSILIAAIGITMLEIQKIRIGNLLPAIFMPILWYALQLAWHAYAG
ncbi:MAG: DUF554 domain-containing protein, partial [Spirochaetota bacterium]